MDADERPDSRQPSGKAGSTSDHRGALGSAAVFERATFYHFSD